MIYRSSLALHKLIHNNDDLTGWFDLVFLYVCLLVVVVVFSFNISSIEILPCTLRWYYIVIWTGKKTTKNEKKISFGNDNDTENSFFFIVLIVAFGLNIENDDDHHDHFFLHEIEWTTILF